MRYGIAAVLALGLVGLLALALGLQPEPVENLSARVEAALAQSGVEHPVTAVLLNFRSYDTLLEIAVLVLAVTASLAVGKRDDPAPAPAFPDPLLRALADWLTPLMILVTGYLLWAGKQQPGGAFQAGAVLAAAGVLLRLSGVWPAPRQLATAGRAGLIGGLALFLLVAALPVLQGQPLLSYPQGWAGTLILLIETGLTVSIAWILVSLFDAPPAPLASVQPSLRRPAP